MLLVWLQLALGNLILQCQLCDSFVDGRAYAFDALWGSTYSTGIDERTLEVVEEIRGILNSDAEADEIFWETTGCASCRRNGSVSSEICLCNAEKRQETKRTT